MQIGKGARRVAHALAIASALAVAGLPCASVGAQPATLYRVGPPPLDGLEEWEALPLTLRPTLHPFASQEPFELSAATSPADALRWRVITRAMEHERGLLARCRIEPDGCPPGISRFLAIVEAARGKDGRARLGEVNRAVNLAIRYRSDAARHGAADAWASPLATFAAGEGDCEDYAIAKYAALREAGVAPGDLRLVLVRDARLSQDHAVVAARLEDRWLILDNRGFLLVEDRVSAYRPLATFGAGIDPLDVAAGSRQDRPEAAPQAAVEAPARDPS